MPEAPETIFLDTDEKYDMIEVQIRAEVFRVSVIEALDLTSQIALSLMLNERNRRYKKGEREDLGCDGASGNLSIPD